MGQDQDLDTAVLSSLTALITDKIKLPESGCISQLKRMFLIKIIPVEKEVKYTSLAKFFALAITSRVSGKTRYKAESIY